MLLVNIIGGWDLYDHSMRTKIFTLVTDKMFI